ncbi:hypothetical protein HXA35_19690 [Bacillus sp. A301a_S52]|nr:hypothetical protein [Bacillus sp. A301a_S52]
MKNSDSLNDQSVGEIRNLPLIEGAFYTNLIMKALVAGAYRKGVTKARPLTIFIRQVLTMASYHGTN